MMPIDQMATEQIYRLIAQRSGAITMQELDNIVGDSKRVREAVTRLVQLDKIRRRRTFLDGSSRISYVYEDMAEKRLRPLTVNR